MKYDTELYDFPVVDRISGELVGYMRGIICQPGQKKVDGIVFEERSWMRRCHYIPWQAVSVIGDKSIVIDSTKKNRVNKNTVCQSSENKVFTPAGSYIGRISNYIIDEHSGDVLGMEISASFMDDLKFGRKIIENRGNIMKGEDFLMLVNSQEPVNTEYCERRSDDEGLC
jgi:uncharacterized protein YrrD